MEKNCKEHKKLGNYFCNECKTLLCMRCKICHKKDMEDHEIISFEEESCKLMEEIKNNYNERSRLCGEYKKTINELKKRISHAIKQFEGELIREISSWNEHKDYISMCNQCTELKKEIEKMNDLESKGRYNEIYFDCMNTMSRIRSSAQKDKTKIIIPLDPIKSEISTFSHFLTGLLSEEFSVINKDNDKIKTQTQSKDEAKASHTEKIKGKLKKIKEGVKEDVKDDVKEDVKKDVKGEKDEVQKADNMNKVKTAAKCKKAQTLIIENVEKEEDAIYKLREYDLTLYNRLYINLWNSTGDNLAKCLASMIAKHKNITSFYLSSERLTDSGVKFLVDAINENERITSFYISGAKITDEGAKLISGVVMNSKTLTSFSASGKLITDKGVIDLTRSIKKNALITSFYIYGAGITDKGVESIARCIRENTNIVSFYFFSANKISSKGIGYLIGAIADHKSIKNVNIFSSGTTKEDIISYIKKFKEATSGLKVYIGDKTNNYLEYESEVEVSKEHFEKLKVVNCKEFIDNFIQTEIGDLNYSL